MLSFVKICQNMMGIEKKIINTNAEYNLIAYGKDKLENEDVFKQYKESIELETERYLIKSEDEYIGIIEFGMSSPRSNKPWLSLLLIDKAYQGLGYAKGSYLKYESLMREKEVKDIQIAVHATNKRAFNFWTSLGFSKYDERVLEDKRFYSLEKKLG